MTRRILARMAAVLALALLAGTLSACSNNAGGEDGRRGSSGFYGAGGSGINWR
jgi:hypothetical protein